MYVIIYIIFEFLSVLKNMVLCKMPIPKKLQKFLNKLLKEFTQENESLARTPAEEKSIKEEEDFKEFLARIEEKFGYEEQLQQTM